MSNPDSFIDEVNEELKRDRLFAALRKYGWIAVVLVFGIVGAAAWTEWSKAQATARAQTFGDAIVAALQPEDAAVRRAALDALIAEQAGDDRARAGIVRLLAAAEALEAGDRSQALAMLAVVADDPTLPVSYRQLATLKRVVAAGPEDIPLAERQALIAPLTAPGGAFRPLALEQQALLRLEAGDREGAIAGLTALLSEPDLTPGLQGRVLQVITILGGGTPPTDQG